MSRRVRMYGHPSYFCVLTPRSFVRSFLARARRFVCALKSDRCRCISRCRCPCNVYPEASLHMYNSINNEKSSDLSKCFFFFFWRNYNISHCNVHLARGLPHYGPGTVLNVGVVSLLHLAPHRLYFARSY